MSEIRFPTPNLSENIPVRLVAFMCAWYARKTGAPIEQVADEWSRMMEDMQGTAYAEFHAEVLYRFHNQNAL